MILELGNHPSIGPVIQKTTEVIDEMPGISRFQGGLSVGYSSAHVSEIFFSFRHRELYFETLSIPTIAQTMRLLFSKKQIYGFPPLPPTSTWKLAASAQI